jgi:hypothetical protein
MPVSSRMMGLPAACALLARLATKEFMKEAA